MPFPSTIARRTAAFVVAGAVALAGAAGLGGTARERAAGLDLIPQITMSAPAGTGYWVAGANGGVGANGSAKLYGAATPPPGSTIVAAAPTPTGHGYWLAAADGAVFAFGDAKPYGGMNHVGLNAAIVGMAATPTGRGYLLLGADGGIFTFGDAHFHGSTGGLRLNARVLDLALTASGDGYWLVAADGGVFSFGDARFHGSTGALHLAAPVTSMAAAADGRGYWLVASDGGIFAFGVPFVGSLAGSRFGRPGPFPATVRMRAIPSADGYYLLGADGSVAALGAAPSLGATSPAPSPAVDLMLTPVPPVPLAAAIPAARLELRRLRDQVGRDLARPHTSAASRLAQLASLRAEIEDFLRHTSARGAAADDLGQLRRVRDEIDVYLAAPRG